MYQTMVGQMGPQLSVTGIRSRKRKSSRFRLCSRKVLKNQAFLRRLAKVVAQAFSTFPHFMPTTSTMLGIFLSFFSLTGVLPTEQLSEPSMGID